MLKSDRPLGEFADENPKPQVSSKGGEPTNWDGFSSVFILLAERYAGDLTKGEEAWLRALKDSGDLTAAPGA